jgi:hypothetical protein
MIPLSFHGVKAVGGALIAGQKASMRAKSTTA